LYIGLTNPVKIKSDCCFEKYTKKDHRGAVNMDDYDKTQIKIEIATEEWKGLEEIIRHFDSQLFIIYGWLATGLTALTAAAVTDFAFSPDSYLLVSCGLLAFTVTITLLQRIVKNRAVERARAVESFLRKFESETYDGPIITSSLKQPISSDDFLEEFFRPRVFLIVFMLVVIIICTYAFKRGEIERDPSLVDKTIKVEIKQ
jgi:hypothetical protein